MRIVVFLALVLAALLIGFAPSVQAELDCTDFLTFTDPGNTKLPQDAFDYNTSIAVIRVASGRVNSFLFPEVEKGYFFVAASPYKRLNVTAGSVLYQYTRGVTEFYYRIFNGSSISWYCSSDKMADLKVSARFLTGSFYSASGQFLNATNVSALEFDAGLDNGFLVPGFGSVRRFLVGVQSELSGLPVGYVIYDAGNNTFVATDYKQVRFHVPASATAFCKDWGFLCMDSNGIRKPACRGSGFHSYFCSSNACVTNMTACPHGCQNAACLAPEPSSSPTPAPSLKAAVTTQVSSTLSATVVATVSAAPVAPGGGFGTILIVAVILAVLAGGAYFLKAKRRPKGL